MRNVPTEHDVDHRAGSRYRDRMKRAPLTVRRRKRAEYDRPVDVRTTIIALGIALQSACGREAAAPARPITAVFDCGGYAFTVRFEDESARLTLPDRTLVLPRAIAASGARYTDGVVTFWNKGDEALLELDGTTREGCRVRR